MFEFRLLELLASSCRFRPLLSQSVLKNIPK